MNHTDHRSPVGPSTGPLLLSALLLGLTPAVSSQSVSRTFEGVASGNRLGTSVAVLGDIDGDRIDDVAVGAIIDASTAGSRGVVRVYSGATGTEVHTIRGSSALDFFGNSCAAAGDVNGDGVPDLIVGAPFEDPAGAVSAGRATVFSGADASVIWTFNGTGANDQLGFAVAGIGDANGDGYDDLVVGAWLADVNGLDSGRALVYSGVDGTVLHDLPGGNLGDNFGYSVAGAGDVDGDGYGDILVGAYRADLGGNESGSAYVYSGIDGTEIWRFDGDGPVDRLGFAVAGVGDVDRDGFDDVAVGMPGDDNTFTDAGAARVFSGATGMPLYTFDGDDLGDDFGNAVAAAGDVDNDGYPDILVGAFGDTDNGPDAGSARVFSGFDGSTLASITNSTAGDRLGWSVAGGGGDVDGDGFSDVVVGARGEDPMGSIADAGTAYVYDLGTTGSPWRAYVFGAACVGGGGNLPRIRLDGPSLIGETVDIQLWAAAPSTTTTMFIGQPLAMPLPLDVLGLTGCSIYTDSFLDLGLPTDALGRATFTVPIANDPGLIGEVLEFQFATLDAAAPYPLPLTFSQGLQMLMGN